MSFVPRVFVAGDTVSFLIPGSTYPAPDWGANFVISTATPVVKASTAEAIDHRIAMTSDDTKAIRFGRHNWTIVWTGPGGVRFTEGGDTILVLPNPLEALTPTFSMQALQKVEAAILKLSGNTNAQIIVDGEQYTKRNFKELCDYRDRLIATVESELISIGRVVSRGGAKKIQTYFRN